MTHWKSIASRVTPPRPKKLRDGASRSSVIAPRIRCTVATPANVHSDAHARTASIARLSFSRGVIMVRPTNILQRSLAGITIIAAVAPEGGWQVEFSSRAGVRKLRGNKFIIGRRNRVCRHGLLGPAIWTRLGPAREPDGPPPVAAPRPHDRRPKKNALAVRGCRGTYRHAPRPWFCGGPSGGGMRGRPHIPQPAARRR